MNIHLRSLAGRFRVILIATCGLVLPVHAQILEEIVVTAQKREQSLQDVGVSVSAFTGHQMEALGWDNSLDVASQTPGLVATSNTGDSANIALFSIRGVSQLDFAEGQEAPVALYRDEAYVSSPGASGAPTFDIERIEVLRGPQGTLYGRNATGGLVHFVSNKPSDEFSAGITANVGDFGRRGLDGFINGSLSDSVNGRLAVYYNKDDGYIENTIGSDRRADDTVSVRGMLDVNFNDRTSLLLISQFTDINTRGGVFHARASRTNEAGENVFCEPGDTNCGNFTADLPPGQNGFFSGGALFDTANGQIDDGDGSVFRGAFDRTDSGVDRDSFNTTAILKTELRDGIELTSVTDFTTSDKVYREDDDSTRFAVVTYDATADVDQFSQELRLAGSTETINWIAGLYFLDIDNLFTGAFAFPSDGYFPTFEGDSETSTISAFGQLDVALNDNLLLTAGLRWTRDDKDFVYTFVQCEVTSEFGDGFCPARLISDPVRAASPFAANENFDGLLVDGFPHAFSREDTEVSGTLRLDWTINENTLVYGGYSRGVKGGGFNTPSDGFDIADIEFVGFDPEILNSYEVGIKTSFADGLARLNASAYYYDYENFQAFFFADTTSRLINSEADFVGAEVELTVSPGNGWDILLGLALIDTEVNGASPDGGTIIDNQQAPLAPDVSANALVRKSFELNNGASFIAQVSANYVGEQFFNVVNAEVTEGGDYALVDTRATYVAPDGRWEASVYVNNLFDEEALNYSYDITGFGNYTIQTFGPPRWVGAELKFEF